MDEKPTILLLPGMEGTGRLFRWLVPHLENQFAPRVVAYPANELLTYEQLADFVAAQAPATPFVVVAESFSGPIAAILAGRRLSNLCGIIFIASFVASPVADWIRFLPLRRMFSLMPPKTVLRWLLLDRDCHRETVKEVQSAIASVSSAVLEGRVNEIQAANGVESLRTSNTSVVSIYASNDRLIGLQGNDTILRARPDATTIKIEGPHLLAQTRADEVAAIVCQYTQLWTKEKNA